MKNNKSSQNIIDYWNAVERFTPHKLDTKSKFGYVKSIQQEVLGAQDIPWQSRERFCHQETPGKTWVYNVFVGIINGTDITRLIKQMIESNEEDYNLQDNNKISCLCTFQLNNYGEILEDTEININSNQSLFQYSMENINVNEGLSHYSEEQCCNKNTNNKSLVIPFSENNEYFQKKIHLDKVKEKIIDYVK